MAAQTLSHTVEAAAAHGFNLVPIVVLLGAAVIAVPLFKRLGLGSVLGYLAAGLAIGPFGISLFSAPQSILHVAELGVVMFLLPRNPPAIDYRSFAHPPADGANSLHRLPVIPSARPLLAIAPDAPSSRHAPQERAQIASSCTSRRSLGILSTPWLRRVRRLTFDRAQMQPSLPRALLSQHR